MILLNDYKVYWIPLFSNKILFFLVHAQEIPTNTNTQQSSSLQTIEEVDKISTSFPSSNLSKTITKDRSEQLNNQQSFTIWNYWKYILIGLVIVGIVVAIILFIVIHTRSQSKLSGNSSK